MAPLRGNQSSATVKSVDRGWDFTISTDESSDRVLVILTGPFLRGEAHDKLHARLDELIRGTVQCVVLDLREIVRLDSSAIGELSYFVGSKKAIGAVFAVLPQYHAPHDLLVRTKFVQQVDVSSSREEAVGKADRWLKKSAN